MVLSKAHVCYSAGDSADALRNLVARGRLADATAIYRLRRPRGLEVSVRQFNCYKNGWAWAWAPAFVGRLVPWHWASLCYAARGAGEVQL